MLADNKWDISEHLVHCEFFLKKLKKVIKKSSFLIGKPLVLKRKDPRLLKTTST